MALFPSDFLWGIGSAAYCVEGGAEGRGETIWDRFALRPGAIRDGARAGAACDQLHRWKEDLEHLRRLGVGAYRFSLSWARVIPEGTGSLSPAGMDYYERFVDALAAAGIRPVAVLHHWDLPQALEEAGGWPNPDTASRFGDYAAGLFGRLGDRVGLWITHHDPWAAAFQGYGSGRLAPGLRREEAAVRAADVLLLSHTRAAEAFRVHRRPGSLLGAALTLTPVLPASDSPEDGQAADWADAYLNRWLLDPLLRGAYPPELLEVFAQRLPSWQPKFDGAPEFRPDFLGVNYFTCRRVGRSRRREELFRFEPVPEHARRTATGWEIHPEGLQDVLLRLDRDYGRPELYLTATGASFEDIRTEDGAIEDRERIAFLEEHLIQAHRALAAGARLRGFFPWSFLDGFEWSFGYSRPFGLLAVDRQTLKRSWKGSAGWYRARIAAGGL